MASRGGGERREGEPDFQFVSKGKERNRIVIGDIDFAAIHIAEKEEENVQGTGEGKREKRSTLKLSKKHHLDQ